MSALQRLRAMIAAALARFQRPGGTAANAKPGLRAFLNTTRGRILAGAGLVAIAIAAALLLRPPLVAVAPVTRGEAIDVVYATGVVDYVRQARIAPIVTAPIYRVYVEEGQRVRVGAALAQLEDGPARGTAAQMEAQASMARLSAGRVETLYRRGFASRAAWEEARGQRDAARAAAQSSRARLGDYSINAPFAGTVLRRDAEPGDQATPSRVLFVLADESSLRVTADLDERDIARVAIGQAALVRADAFPGESFGATVSEVTPQGDAATRVFRVRLALDPSAALRAGMTVEANIIASRREDAVLAPAGAARDGVVWTIEQGRVRRHEVVVGASGEQRVEIRQGIEVGAWVVVEPPASLRNGQRVRTRAADAAP